MYNVKSIILGLFILFFVVGCTQQTTNEPTVPDTGVTSPEEGLLPDIIVTVNGQDIMKEDLFDLETQMQIVYGFSPSTDQIVEQLVAQVVLEQIIDTMDYDFTADDVETFFIEQGINLDEIKEELEFQNIDYDQFLIDNIPELELAQFIFEIQQSIEVTEDEMISFYEEHKDSLDEEVTFEEVQQEIYTIFLNERTNDLLILILEDGIANSEIIYHYE